MRAIEPGGTCFLTVRLVDRDSTLLVDHAYDLRRAVKIVRLQHPFEIVAWVNLPAHAHAVISLPSGDDAFVMRWSLVRAAFDRAIAVGHRSHWERRFRTRAIRTDRELDASIDAIHDDPVRHGHVERAADWPFSSFQRYVRRGERDVDWALRRTSVPDAHHSTAPNRSWPRNV